MSRDLTQYDVQTGDVSLSHMDRKWFVGKQLLQRVPPAVTNYNRDAPCSIDPIEAAVSSTVYVHLLETLKNVNHTREIRNAKVQNPPDTNKAPCPCTAQRPPWFLQSSRLDFLSALQFKHAIQFLIFVSGRLATMLVNSHSTQQLQKNVEMQVISCVMKSAGSHAFDRKIIMVVLVNPSRNLSQRSWWSITNRARLTFPSPGVGFVTLR